MQTKRQQLLAEAEANIAAAKREGGNSPSMERVIDALDALVEAMKVEPDFYSNKKPIPGIREIIG